jgi:hypothetical protein
MEKMDTTADNKPPAPKIGELLIKDGLVTKEDIERALEIQKEEIKESELPLGMLLVKNGRITKTQLQRLLDHPYLRKYIGNCCLGQGCYPGRKNNSHRRSEKVTL